MIELLWPWMFLLLPLPWALRRWLTPADSDQGVALRVPFFSLLQSLDHAGVGRGRRPGPLWAWLAWGLLLLAAAQPLWLGTPGRLPATGRDLMLAIDISGSMRSQDFTYAGEPLDRLSMVKRVAGRFIEGRHGDRLGLILFGSQPYLRAPLSFDRVTIKALLDEAEVALAGEYTAIGDAIGLAIKRLRERPAQSRVLVLLTDGANNEGHVGPRQAALLAASLGIRIYTIGVGRQQVSAPNPYGVWSAQGAAAFEQEVLEDVALSTGGLYFHALDGAALEAAYQRLDQLEPALGEEVKTYFATPLYPWPLAGALLLSLWPALRGRRP